MPNRERIGSTNPGGPVCGPETPAIMPPSGPSNSVLTPAARKGAKASPAAHCTSHGCTASRSAGGSMSMTTAYPPASLRCQKKSGLPGSSIQPHWGPLGSRRSSTERSACEPGSAVLSAKKAGSGMRPAARVSIGTCTSAVAFGLRWMSDHWLTPTTPSHNSQTEDCELETCPVSRARWRRWPS